MAPDTNLLVATGTGILRVDPGDASVREGRLPDGARPTCLATRSGHAWCGTKERGVLRSGDGGRTWAAAGLEGRHVTAVAACPAEEDVLWAGTEPSALWRSGDGGESWERREGLRDLSSSSEWSFPPRPDTDHVRWITCHPERAGHLFLAIEAGALVTTPDGGGTWRDRVAGGPRDTHELAIHPARSATLRAAAGDGYFESRDGGGTWSSPMEGFDVGYLRSVAVDPSDPEVVVVSASSRAKTAYVAGRADGRLYRREGEGPWRRVLDGWPDPPDTIAPLLLAGPAPEGALWAADERGVHRSDDGGRRWDLVAPFPSTPSHLRGVAIPGR